MGMRARWGGNGSERSTRMRLTSEIVTEAEQGLNCLGERELVLRNLAIAVIENLALAKDSFDIIDLTGNMIRLLGDGFPPFPRLGRLYVSHNRIEGIGAGLAASLPNLTTVILTSNRIAGVKQLNLPELRKLKRLETLCVSDNPVANVPNIRRIVISALPQLKVLNFSKVLAHEREGCSAWTTGTKDGQRQEQLGGEQGGEQSGDKRMASHLEKTSRASKARKLNAGESKAVRTYIEQASCIEEVSCMQEALRNGTALQLLASVGEASAGVTNKGG